MKYSTFALVASFATTIVALPYVAERDVVVVTKTDVHVDQVEVTQFVTAGAPAATTAVTVSAAAPSSSSAAEQHDHHPHGGNHWSISHSESASAAPVVVSTTAPAPAPPAPTTSTTSAAAPPPVTTPQVTTSADAPKAPAANNPGSKTGGMTYTTPVNPYPTPSPLVTDGDESYNPFDGNLQQNSLNAHNAVRAQYGANPVHWNYTLEQYIIDVNNNKGEQKECVFAHSVLGDFGQNIAAQTGGNVQSMVDMWSSEAKDVNWATKDFSKAGHFTAMVWRDVESIACGAIKCGNGGSQVNKDHKDADGKSDFWNGWFYECNYYPTPNVGGEYADQVKQKGS